MDALARLAGISGKHTRPTRAGLASRGTSRAKEACAPASCEQTAAAQAIASCVIRHFTEIGRARILLECKPPSLEKCRAGTCFAEINVKIQRLLSSRLSPKVEEAKPRANGLAVSRVMPT